ncbi:hypothetical protein MTO96_032711 [Rhipicephalus appendiculatus]
MATSDRDYDSSTESSSESGGLPDNVVPTAHRNVASNGVNSRRPATVSTAPRLLAVAAPGRDDLVVLVDTSALRVPVPTPPASPTDLTTSPERRFLDHDEATPPGRTRLRTAVGFVGRLDIPPPLVVVAAPYTLPYLEQEHRSDGSARASFCENA